MSDQVTRADVVLKASDAFDELINWLTLLGVNWWVHAGWSVRKVEQEVINGSGRTHHEQEPRSRGIVASEVAPGDDDRDGVARASVERRVFQALAKQALARKTTAPRRPRSRRRRR